MSRDEIEKRLKQELSKAFNRDVGAFTVDVRFKEDLAASSMQKMILVAVVKEMSNKAVTYGELNKCKTVGELIDFAERLVHG